MMRRMPDYCEATVKDLLDLYYYGWFRGFLVGAVCAEIGAVIGLVLDKFWR